MSDCGLLSCALIERVNKGRKPPKRGMAGRETRIPKGLVPHRRSGIHRGFSYIAHKRRNARFKGLRRDTHHPIPEPRTQRLTGRNTGRFRWGWYHYPRRALCGPEPLRAQRSEEHTLPSLHGPRERRREAESLRNGDAHRARLRSEAPRPRRVALLHCCFLHCTSKLRGSLSLRRRAERKIC